MNEEESRPAQLQLMSPELEVHSISKTIQSFKENMEFQITHDNRFIYDGWMEIAHMDHPFGDFKKAEMSVDLGNYTSEHPWVNDDTGIFLSFIGDMYLEEDRYFSNQDVDNICRNFQEHGGPEIKLEKDNLENGMQRLNISNGKVGMKLIMGFPGKTDAEKSNVKDAGFKGPVSKISVWFYPFGDGRDNFNIEPYEESEVKSQNTGNVDDLAARVPDCLSLMAQTMNVINYSVNPQRKDLGLINWTDTDANNGITVNESVVFNSAGQSIGAIVGGSGDIKKLIPGENGDSQEFSELPFDRDKLKDAALLSLVSFLMYEGKLEDIDKFTEFLNNRDENVAKYLNLKTIEAIVSAAEFMPYYIYSSNRTITGESLLNGIRNDIQGIPNKPPEFDAEFSRLRISLIEKIKSMGFTSQSNFMYEILAAEFYESSMKNEKSQSNEEPNPSKD